MSDFYEEIEIPEMDLWSILFERKDKPFSDDQGISSLTPFPFTESQN